MKHPDKEEILSQLMDGEWQDIDSQARLAELCKDPELKATWARYHLIRDVMKSESVKVDTDIASRVHEMLEDEPTHSNVTFIGGQRVATEAPEKSEEQAASSTSKRPILGGLAVAASVALATVVGLNYLRSDTATPNDNLQAAASLPQPSNPQILPGQVLPQIELVANRGSYWVNSTAADRDAKKEERLNMFMSQHIENSPTASYRGMLPYSRLVGYDEISTEQ
jgi:sigma-E factor negative regulatory protein RseA